MATHLFRRTMTAILLSSLTLTTAWGGDNISQSRRTAKGDANAARQDVDVGDRSTLPVAQTRYTSSWAAPVRLPRMPDHEPSVSAGGASRQPVDGTWREDGRYLIINLGGKQLRLARESATQGVDKMPVEKARTGGAVQGRLLHKGRPLPNCRIALSRLKKGFFGYTFDKSAEPLRAVTDVRGVYCFESVPAGAYKLSWLPQGTNRWIRRISMQPDATTHDNEVVSLKDIRIALQTIN